MWDGREEGERRRGRGGQVLDPKNKKNLRSNNAAFETSKMFCHWNLVLRCRSVPCRTGNASKALLYLCRLLGVHGHFDCSAFCLRSHLLRLYSVVIHHPDFGTRSLPANKSNMKTGITASRITRRICAFQAFGMADANGSLQRLALGGSFGTRFFAFLFLQPIQVL